MALFDPHDLNFHLISPRAIWPRVISHVIWPQFIDLSGLTWPQVTFWTQIDRLFSGHASTTRRRKILWSPYQLPYQGTRHLLCRQIRWLYFHYVWWRKWHFRSYFDHFRSTSGQNWFLHLAPVLLWRVLYQRRRWLLPRLRRRMYAKYPANNGAHAGFYSEGAWRRPRYSSVESISLPSLRKLFISNSKISKIFLQNFHRKFLDFFEDFQNFTWFRKIGMKSPSRENLLCVWLLSFSLKKNLKVEWVEIFFEFFENFRFYFSFEFLVWKRFTSFYSFW